MTEALKRTPLYEEHSRLGAKLVGFGGWELPVRYRGVIEEHRAVRERVGLFDICHMGQILVAGRDAERALNLLTCNDVRALYNGRAQYNAILNPAGGVVDDIIIYRLTQQRFLVCVNAANTEKDFAWLRSRWDFDAELADQSRSYGLLAVQGPAAAGLVKACWPAAQLESLRYYHFKEAQLDGAAVIAARTGYTGEDGFELFAPRDGVAMLWKRLIEEGRPFGLLPIGLGARDSLRLEAAYPLHGHELREEISALESGLGWIVKFSKGDFLGREALLRIKDAPPRKLVGFFVEEPGIVREGAQLLDEKSEAVGEVASGTLTPTLGRALGLAIVASGRASIGSKLWAVVRGKNVRCGVVQTPFYSKKR